MSAMEPVKTVGDRTYQAQAAARGDGTVVYHVDGVGCFTLGWDSVRTSNGGERALRVQYGTRPPSGHGPVTDQPVLNRVPLSGAGVFRTETVWTAQPGNYRWLVCHRDDRSGYGTTEVPPATHKRAADLVQALALHFLARPDAEHLWRLHLADAASHVLRQVAVNRRRLLRDMATEERALADLDLREQEARGWLPGASQ